MEKNVFLQLLNEAMNEKRFVSVSTDKDNTDRFTVGFILNIDEETILLNSINPDGYDDGLILININDVYLIEYDDLYLKQLRFIHENSIELSKKATINLPSINENEDIFYKMLDKCQEEGILISINLSYGIGLTGVIKKIDSEFVILQSINESGQEDGVTCFKISDIIRIFIDDKNIRKIQLLNKFKIE
jgi:hypothetical protein